MAQKLRRLQVILAERTNWAAQLVQVKGMRQWVRDAEHILDGSWAQADEVVTNATVGQRLDAWRQQMAQQVTDARLSELEQECLAHFLQILTHLRPHLVQCYDRKDFPRTNNELERSIRGLKTQYRRIAGARTGTAISYATGARLPTPPGGSRIRSIASNWSTELLAWIAHAGVNSDGKPKRHRASSSSAFASATSARPILLRSRGVGLPSLPRALCPDGFFLIDFWYTVFTCHRQADRISSERGPK